VQPDLSTPGEMIRSQREERGLSLDALSQRTKIPARVLAAIERDEFHKVSGALYIKSFLRTCAAELGLDAEEVMDKYNLFAGEMGRGGVSGGDVWREEEVQISRIGWPWRLIGIVAFAVALILVIGFMSVRGCQSDERDTAEQPVDPQQAQVVVDEVETMNESPSSAVSAVDSLARSFATSRAPDTRVPDTRAPDAKSPSAKVVETEPSVIIDQNLGEPLVGTSDIDFLGEIGRAHV